MQASFFKPATEKKTLSFPPKRQKVVLSTYFAIKRGSVFFLTAFSPLTPFSIHRSIIPPTCFNLTVKQFFSRRLAFPPFYSV